MQDFSTPMMKQYIEIKKQYMDCLLFFRMGDFYELFLEDAHIGAKVLDIVLTSRSKGKDGRIPMAGVPYHAVDSYISKLVKAGYKVAICEQITEPNKYGIVEREVIRIITPGTILDEHSLEQKEHNYIMSLIVHGNIYGIAFADVTTGLFQILEIDNSKKNNSLLDEIMRMKPSECILTEDLYNNPEILKQLKAYKDLNIYPIHDGDYFVKKYTNIIEQQFGKQLSVHPNIFKLKTALQAAAVLIGYLQYTQKDNITHFKTISLLASAKEMVLDYSTVLNLELFSTLRTKQDKGTLIHFLDNTFTAMGGRKLREWVQRPLINKEEICKRQEVVSEMLQNISFRKELQTAIKSISDIERTVSRLSLRLGNARDLIQLRDSLKQILVVKKIISSSKIPLIEEINNAISNDLQNIIEKIDKTIVNLPPIVITEGGMIKSGVDKELDSLHEIIYQNKEWLEMLEKQERQRTGISSLKIRFNKVFGFYIEISKANLENTPSNYFRKQTLVNAERFITDELKRKEEIILAGEEKIFVLELNIYKKLLEEVLQKTSIIQNSANSIAILDCLLNFANIAEINYFSKPKIIDSGEIIITEGRHPVVEQSIGDEQFVPNDTYLDSKNNQLLLITGPNMAGKSVYIRQVAVIVLLNQIGSFIPARKAELSIVDRIFVRSGASDIISEGLSTFMVEMVETAQIIQKATSDSLVIMDEIGRGTSTYDGISISWAIAEYLVSNKNNKPKTLFATHYHELQELEEQHKNIKNYHMAIQDENNKPVFLYTLMPGGTSHSYGIAVAHLAGIPDEVINSSYNVLKNLEKRETETAIDENIINQKTEDSELVSALQKVDINNITPMQALELLSKLKKKYEKDT